MREPPLPNSDLKERLEEEYATVAADLSRGQWRGNHLIALPAASLSLSRVWHLAPTANGVSRGSPVQASLAISDWTCFPTTMSRTSRKHRGIDIDAGNFSRNHSTVSSQGVYLAGDGLSHQRTFTPMNVKRARVEIVDLGDPLGGWRPMPSQAPEVETSLPQPAKKTYVSSTNPMAQWRPHKDAFLDKLLRHEGLGNELRAPTCGHCSRDLRASESADAAPRFFQCADCGQYLQCLDCCVSAHLRSPLHVLKEWTGLFWAPAALAELGLVYQIGHGGFPCPFPDTGTHKMTVIDAPHIHTVQLRYCNCPYSQDADHVTQLLRNAWYPATVIDPATCATFRTLRSFRLYNVVGNLNVTDFVTAMERMTNSLAVAGLVSVPDRTRQLQRMSRQWAFLSRLKRSGRAHAPDGVDASPLGSCAVNCWACPHDGRNLPANWRSADKSLQFLYMMILAIDANFRLKNRIRANEINDPPLGPGLAYWVEPAGYQEHVKKYISESDMSTCIAFAALLQKDTRMTTGLRVSGVGGCVCARHECMQPNGLGDLQKGERYCNMDWIFFSAIMSLTLLLLMILYNIACQWKLHLAERMKRLPTHMQANLSEVTLQYGLPIWHADSHNKLCRDKNKLSIRPGAAKTDGEGIERVWAELNPASFSTKEMGLGNRADVLDDRIDNHNFLKNMTLGSTLQRRLLVARDELKRQVEVFAAVSDGVAPDLQRQWKRQVHEWEEDDTRFNPYSLPTADLLTEADIRLQLQQEEREQNVYGRAFIAGGSATAFLSAGIQIQDMQYRIQGQLKETALISADRQIKIEESRDALLRKIRRFRDLQAIYMPGAAAVIAASETQRDGDTPPPPAEEVVLWMPSEMPRSTSGIMGCLEGLPLLEERLRVSQCENSLSQLRFTLHGKRWLIAYRSTNVVGQNQSTRSAKLIESVTERGDRLVDRYRRGFRSLGGLGVLHKYPQLRELKSEDVRLDADHDYSDLDASKKLSAGGQRPSRNAPGGSRRVMSWIWTAPGAFTNDEQQLHETMRVEWVRALARKDRWNEEVQLLEEEMRRVLRYLMWEGDWWRKQGSRRSDLAPELASALQAYSLQQASQCERIMVQFRVKWCMGESRALSEIVTLDSITDLENTA
ncbi:hypothetical protein C8F01DRAFT_1091766 [Mycena amicta]|nr:hypothetical protein C8F01DRAFT_1091766 [Mycena amicta]